jgi:cytochrome c oxidase subunit 4
MAQPGASRKSYFVVFAVLLALTLLTVAMAYFDFEPLNAAIALAIATAKAVLVMVFFMHLRQSSHLARIFAGTGLFWLLILLTFTLSDYFTR